MKQFANFIVRTSTWRDEYIIIVIISDDYFNQTLMIGFLDGLFNSREYLPSINQLTARKLRKFADMSKYFQK